MFKATFLQLVSHKNSWRMVKHQLGYTRVAGLPAKASVSSFYNSVGLISHQLWRQDDNRHKCLIETFHYKTDAIKTLKDLKNCIINKLVGLKRRLMQKKSILSSIVKKARK